MNKLMFFLLLFGMFAFAACNDDDETHTDEPDYQITIVSPNTDDKHVGNEIEVRVEFKDHHGGTVHHINVRLYNKASGEELFSEPTEAHIHETSGMHEFTRTLTLNVDAHTDWILEAKVWGHDAGVAEVTETLEFHVHPQ